MTSDELAAARRKLPCGYLRYYGKPKSLLGFEEAVETGYLKEKAENREAEEAAKRSEYPENLDENGALHFLYLRACVFLNRKPEGFFTGEAEICASVLAGGGSLADMVKAGAGAVYVSCLSKHDLDADIQREIIGSHIPF